MGLASIKAMGGLAATYAYVSGMVACIPIPLNLARKCSAEGSASRMNSAGRDSSVPNISSTEEMALSSLGAVLRPRRT